jgi:oligoendopeptidase F
MAKQPILTWNLTDLYLSIDDRAIVRDFSRTDRLIKQLVDYRGKIANLTPKEMFKLVTTSEELSLFFHKIGLFAGLLDATHVGVDAFTRFSKKIDEIIINKSQEIIFIDVELAHISDEKWEEFLTSEVLAPYRHHLEAVHRDAIHTLTEPEEKILSQKSQTSGTALAHLFEITTSTLEFPWVEGKITLDQLLTKFHDPDNEVRKKVARVLHKGLQSNTRTTPAIYNSLVQDKSISDQLRHYAYPEQSRFDHDEVDQETVTSLIEAVTSQSDSVEKYYELKRKILDIPQLYWWDRYAPLPVPEAKIAIEDAQTMVQSAYQEFSPELGEIVQKMYEYEHIDWLPSSTKHGGAFCASSSKNVYPYVLLNYTDTPRDVMTLAHELGHAVHDVLAQDNNVFLQTHPSLATAEIASVFGESLLFDKLLSSDISREDKIALLMSNIEDSFATVFRQITMFQFEQAVHTKRQAEGELSKEELDSLWQKTIKKPFGKAVRFTKEHTNTWMYIPHIINTPFYVYSYAFAQLCVLALVKQYKEKGTDFVPIYLNLLRAGGSLSPKDNLSQAGLDITQKEFWLTGLSLIEERIKQLEKLIETD